MKAYEHATATGIVKYNGWIPSSWLKSSNIGMAIVAVAAFEINSVINDITNMDTSWMDHGGHDDMERRYWPIIIVNPDDFAPFDKAKLPPEISTKFNFHYSNEYLFIFV